MRDWLILSMPLPGASEWPHKCAMRILKALASCFPLPLLAPDHRTVVGSVLRKAELFNHGRRRRPQTGIGGGVPDVTPDRTCQNCMIRRAAATDSLVKSCLAASKVSS